MKKVLITGAAGYIGSFLRKAWKGTYSLTLNDCREIGDPDGARVLLGDIRDAEPMRKACAGIDTVVHLAADPSPGAEFGSSVLPMNIIGTHHVFQAAADAGVRRVIFASSIHAVGAYPPDVQVKWDMPVRPCCEYGASKCYGEALGRYFADRHCFSFIAVRIGGVHGHPHGTLEHDCRQLHQLVSEDDLAQLLTRCVDAPADLRFAIFHGLSANRFKRLDISNAREVLGYQPTDEVGGQSDACNLPAPEPVHPG